MITLYIRFEELVSELKRFRSVSAYRISSQQVIADIKLLPADFDPTTSSLPQNTAYVCEYYRLKLYSPYALLPPLICVVAPLADVNTALFVNRSVAVVYESSIDETLISLLNAMYAHGSRSSSLMEVSQRLIRCHDLNELLEEGFRILGNPVVLTDANQDIFAATDPSLVSISDYRQVLAAKSLPVGHSNLIGEHPYFGIAENLFVDHRLDDLPLVLCKPLSVLQRIAGYMHIFALNRDFTEEDYYIAELLSNLIAVDLTQHPKHRHTGMNTDVIRFLREILDNTSGNLAQTLERAETLPVKFQDHLYIAVTHVKDNYAHTNFSEIIQTISHTCPNCFCFLYKNSVFTLINSSKEIEDFGACFSSVFALNISRHLVIGVSNCFSSISELCEHTYQAREAIQLGLLLDDGKQLFLYQNYMIHHMVRICMLNETNDEIYAPELARLINYCRTHNDDLLNTLRIYLQCNRSKPETAKLMYVHQNTIKYRIAQIQQITGLDLNDDQTVMRLNLSFLMMDLRVRHASLEEFNAESPPSAHI